MRRTQETGLDYFLARYYSSTEGRFTSPDEFTGGPLEISVLGSGHAEKQALKYAEIINPQSLNKYRYCFNNPLRYTGLRLMKQTGESIMESPFVSEEVVNTAGKSYDFMGGPEAYQNFGTGKEFFRSIVHHVNKAVVSLP